MNSNYRHKYHRHKRWKRESINTSVKDDIKSKTFLTKHTKNLGNYEKAQHKYNKSRRRRIIPVQRPRKYFLQNHKGKLSQAKEGDVYKCKKNTQNTKQTESEKNIPESHNNLNTKHTEERKNIKSCQRKPPSNI